MDAEHLLLGRHESEHGVLPTNMQGIGVVKRKVGS